MRIHRFVSGTRRRLSFKFWFGLHLSALILLLDPATVHAQTQRKSVTDLTATELMSLRRGVANAAHTRRSKVYNTTRRQAYYTMSFLGEPARNASRSG
jgi:hypothetical protein